MAKLKMKAVRIIALKKDRKRLLEHLQNSSLVHVTQQKELPDGFIRADTSSQLQRFERNAHLGEEALKILDKVQPEKKSLLSSFRGRKTIEPETIGAFASNSVKIISVCNKIRELDKLRADYAAERVRIKIDIAKLEPWHELDIPMNTPDTASTAVFIGSFSRYFDLISLSEAIAAENSDLLFTAELFYSSANLTCAVIFTPKKQREQAENTLRALGFTAPLNPTSRTPAEKVRRLKKKEQDLEELSEQAAKDIADLERYRSDIGNTVDYFLLRSEKYKVISQLDQTEHIFVLNGYIPEEDCTQLSKLCERVSPSCIVEFEEAGEDAPVKLKNNRFAEPAESIVMMYSPPSHEDIDPTPLLAFFYYFFFGMMFSDAGYGLLMVIATALALLLLKPDKPMRNTLKLFQYCGYGTILWGLIFGSIFGDAPAVLYKLITGQTITMQQLLPWPTLDTQKDALTIMIMSIGFGLIHILVGMGCKFYICLRQKRYAEAFFDTGLWMLMLVGFAILAAGMAFSQVLTYIGGGIAIACAIGLILTQGRAKKGIFGKLIGGVASLYDITSYVSDLLSYSRLLALGLTTGVMAQVFNMLSTLLGTSWFGILYMIVIFVVGHLVTIALNALGSYVHTMRLQYVEMFSKFYEGGGKLFTPFSINSKHFKINEKD